MSISNSFAGVSNCYVFKSQLQEYAQKAGIPSPMYETTKEGPSHEPFFRSTVIVNNVKYDSLPGFFNRKAAEQSAAEIALMELAKSGNMNKCISHPVHETGLCKNLLQEYAQKMNHAIPLYVCLMDKTPGNVSFSCTVEIGGIQYIGAAARTKKEAEIKAARTALLAIQSNAGGPEGGEPSGSSQFTVVPCKKKGTESGTTHDETVKSLKPKKARFKNKWPKKRLPKNNGEDIKFNQTEQATGNMENVSQVQVENVGMLEVSKDGRGVQHVGSELDQNYASGIQDVDSGVLVMEANLNFQDALHGKSIFNRNEREISIVEGAADIQVGNSGILVADTNDTSQDVMALNFNQNERGHSSMEILCGVQIKDLAALVMEVNKVCAAGQMSSMGTNASMSEPKAPDAMVENPLSKDHLVDPDGSWVVGCELRQRVGAQVHFPQDGYKPTDSSQSEPVSGRMQL